MQIQSSFYNSSLTHKGINSRRVKDVTYKTKSAFKKVIREDGFMKTPIKYYLIGLALPIPFASTAGLVLGMVVAVAKKFFNKENKEHSS